ncbi:MAG: hypothetical protein ABF755_00975 [Oenococcus oeni]
METFSTDEKVNIMKWFDDHHMTIANDHENHVKLQKGLVFYELFSCLNSKKHDLSRMELYQEGPVFTQVYGDVHYRINDLKDRINNFSLKKEEINNVEAEKSLVLSSIYSADELSTMSHQFDFYRNNYHEHKSDGDDSVTFEEGMVTKDDNVRLHNLFDMVDEKLLFENSVWSSNGMYFVIDKNTKVQPNEFEKLENIALKNSQYDDSSPYFLSNPIYVSRDQDGVLSLG